MNSELNSSVAKAFTKDAPTVPVKELTDAKVAQLPQVKESKKLKDEIETKNSLLPLYNQFKDILTKFHESIKFLNFVPSPDPSMNNFFRKPEIVLSSNENNLDANEYVYVEAFSSDSLNQSIKFNIKSIAQGSIYGAKKIFSSRYTSLGFTGTIKINGEDFSINADDTLNSIVNKFNNSSDETGINFKIINLNLNQYYLVMQSNDTGLINNFDLSKDDLFLDDTADSEINSRLLGGLIDPDNLIHSKKFNNIFDSDQPAQDSTISIIFGNRKIDRTSSNSKFENILDGVNITALRQNTDNDKYVEIKLEVNLPKIKSAIEEFVLNYNNLMIFVAKQRFLASREENPEPNLQKDSIFNDIINDIQREMNNNVSTGNSFTSLFNIGYITIPSASYKDEELDFEVRNLIQPRTNSYNTNYRTLTQALTDDLPNVQKMFELNFSSSSDKLFLLRSSNNLNRKIKSFEVMINDNNISNNSYDQTKKVAISYQISGNNFIFYPKVERQDDNMQIECNNDPYFKNFIFFYLGLPVVDTKIEVNVSEGIAFRLNNLLENAFTRIESHLNTISENNKKSLQRISDLEKKISEKKKDIERDISNINEKIINSANILKNLEFTKQFNTRRTE